MSAIKIVKDTFEMECGRSAGLDTFQKVNSKCIMLIEVCVCPGYPFLKHKTEECPASFHFVAAL